VSVPTDPRAQSTRARPYPPHVQTRHPPAWRTASGVAPVRMTVRHSGPRENAHRSRVAARASPAPVPVPVPVPVLQPTPQSRKPARATYPIHADKHRYHAGSGPQARDSPIAAAAAGWPSRGRGRVRLPWLVPRSRYALRRSRASLRRPTVRLRGPTARCDTAAERPEGCRRTRPPAAPAPRTPRQPAQSQLPRVPLPAAQGAPNDCEVTAAPVSLPIPRPGDARERNAPARHRTTAYHAGGACRHD
jgi:hypothetical protein